jgi:stage V sporulation protein G
MRHHQGNGQTRLKLHADIAHPINATCRSRIEHDVVGAYQQEIERSKQPGYVPPNLDHEDMDFDDVRSGAPTMRLTPDGDESLGRF